MPRKKTNPPRALASPALTARGRCSGCGKLRIVEDGLVVPHLVHTAYHGPSERVECRGAGQSPAGPTVHGAKLETAARRMI